ncbi:hypothetical protein [Embleya sp. NPDC005575]|uniref:hypothetical protein n=1 Tax=Embleya sp. NPDC005575 TaxID=3156892 RepID=UPI0033BD587F
MFSRESDFTRTFDFADQGRWGELTALLLEVEDAMEKGGPELRDLVRLRDHIARVIVGDGSRAAAAWTVEHRYAVDGETLSADVLSSVRTWDEVGPFLTEPRLRALVAHGRVMRGDDLSREADLDRAWGFGVPYALEPWEAEKWDADGFPYAHLPRGGGGHEVPYIAGQYPATEVVAVPGPPMQPAPFDRMPHTYASAARMHGTAMQALARNLHHMDIRDGVQASVVPFSAAYPLLISALGGQSAYGPPPSEAHGRLALWRLLGRMANLTEPLAPEAVAAFVARVECLAWIYPYPVSYEPLYAAHLVIADPVGGTAWVLDGESYD